MKIFSITLLAIMWLINGPAFGQEASVVDRTSFLYDVWGIVQPVVVTLATAVSPIIVGWIVYRVRILLNLQDENAAKQLEEKLREALHSAALNAIKYAMTKHGLPTGGLTDFMESDILKDAMEYVKSKNPDTAKAVGLDDAGLKEILLSKVPDVMAIAAAGEAPKQTNVTVKPVIEVSAPKAGTRSK